MVTALADDLLIGAVDNHVHACPHINARRLDAIEATRAAAAAGMAGIGFLDNFCNSAGIAALIKRNLATLGIDRELDVFGGLIMEPAAGGLSIAAVTTALDYGYEPGDGARFVSLPTHATRHVARLEGRDPSYVNGCFGVDPGKPLPEPLPAILDLIAARDVVLNTGHLSIEETEHIVEVARSRGIQRILVPANTFEEADVRRLTGAGAFVEFSFFFVSHATRVGLTHVDAEKHFIPYIPLDAMATLVRAAGPDRAVVSSDCGVGILPPPPEGLRCFAAGLMASGVPREDLSRMLRDNPARLFKVGDDPRPVV